MTIFIPAILEDKRASQSNLKYQGPKTGSKLQFSVRFAWHNQLFRLQVTLCNYIHPFFCFHFGYCFFVVFWFGFCTHFGLFTFLQLWFFHSSMWCWVFGENNCCLQGIPVVTLRRSLWLCTWSIDLIWHSAYCHNCMTLTFARTSNQNHTYRWIAKRQDFFSCLQYFSIFLMERIIVLFNFDSKTRYFSSVNLCKFAKMFDWLDVGMKNFFSKFEPMLTSTNWRFHWNEIMWLIIFAPA